jgi:hypothetical protein
LCYKISTKASELNKFFELPRNGFTETKSESGHLSRRKGDERMSIKLGLGKLVGR